MIRKFQTKPVEVLAVQWLGENLVEILEILPSKVSAERRHQCLKFVEKGNEEFFVCIGQWICIEGGQEIRILESNELRRWYDPAD